jgi:hypothetical protein
MTNPSNLYAEKIFAEHPLALWALDDRVDFVSLLDNNEKSMSGWTISNGAFVSNPSVSPQVSDSPIVGVSTTNANLVTITSQTIINSNGLDLDKNSINISTHFKSAESVVVKLGYKVGTSTPVTETFNYVPGNQDEWAFLSKSFDLPSTGSNIAIYISLQQEVSITSQFYFNNLSFGQWSEDFNTISSGVVPQLLSSYKTVNLPSSILAIPAQSYGLTNLDGYYLSSSNKLFATNEGFPMVFGASNLTKVIPSGTSDPSVIVPGMGFLNDAGRYVDMTAEMWLRITPETTEARRIFGPISSDYGLYVQGEFLVIKVGNTVGSYFVGEWGRPMLLHFRVSVNTASLLIDGEQVISITTDSENMELPKPFLGDLSQDWLGFYSYDDIQSYEIDCAAIYSYQIPEIVAKRRFVYGQGVEFPELSSASLIGASTFIDYKVANYANNYIYPDMGRWNQGILDNAIVQNNVLQPPKYELPNIVFNNKSITTDAWLQECSLTDGSELFASIDLSLANSPSKNGGYLLFPKMNMLTSEVKGLYGIFKTTSTDSQILFRIENKIDNSSFTISAENTKLKYELDYAAGKKITVYSAEFLQPGIIFAAGIDIDKFAQHAGGPIAKFFGAAGKLSVYVGGQTSFNNTFSGRIYKVAFCTQRNLNKISYLLEDNGTIAVFEGDDLFINAGVPSTVAWDSEFLAGLPETSNWGEVADAGTVDSQSIFEMMSHISSYTLNPRIYLGAFILDVSADSYWQDYVPLSYLSKSITNADGDQIKTLDFIQFNITNPKLPLYKANAHDTSGLQVKTYITFQYMTSGPNNDHINYIYTQKLGKSGVVEPGANWLLTKYEVVDDSIIYLPSDADFNKLAIVLHVEIESKAIISNPIKIKSIQLASQALSSIGPTDINTRFGGSLSAYTMRGIYPDYKAKNPVSIYKSSTPYLYLTNNSGIQMRGILESTKRRGIRSKINPQGSNLYRVGAVQILAKYPESLFPTIPQKLMTISSKTKTVSMYVEPTNVSRTRAKVYILNDKTGLPDTTVFFFLNGVVVKELFITPDTWNMIGLQFTEALDFNSMVGYLDITGPLLVHGMSNYRLTSSQDSITSILRTWSQVRTMIDKDGSAVTNWEDFVAGSQYGIYSWENILYIPTLKTYLVDPRVAYRLYTGTNKIIVGDDNKLRFNNYSYKVYNDIRWQSSTKVAV